MSLDTLLKAAGATLEDVQRMYGKPVCVCWEREPQVPGTRGEAVETVGYLKLVSSTMLWVGAHWKPNERAVDQSGTQMISTRQIFWIQLLESVRLGANEAAVRPNERMPMTEQDTLDFQRWLNSDAAPDGASWPEGLLEQWLASEKGYTRPRVEVAHGYISADSGTHLLPVVLRRALKLCGGSTVSGVEFAARIHRVLNGEERPPQDFPLWKPFAELPEGIWLDAADGSMRASVSPNGRVVYRYKSLSYGWVFDGEVVIPDLDGMIERLTQLRDTARAHYGVWPKKDG